MQGKKKLCKCHTRFFLLMLRICFCMQRTHDSEWSERQHLCVYVSGNEPLLINLCISLYHVGEILHLLLTDILEDVIKEGYLELCMNSV